MKSPRRKTKKQGICIAVSVAGKIGRVSYFAQLSPIQTGSSVEFEDEDVVHLGFCPKLTCQTKEQREQQDKKVTRIQLRLSVGGSPSGGMTHLQQIARLGCNYG
jgi:hypothetical protein